ncbi:MAG: tetratricopeptide repeat protein, partial [Pyrinomonadaceae bacterium]
MRLILLLLLFLPSWYPNIRAQSAQGASPEAARYFADALAAEARADWPTAQRSYLRAIQSAPNWAEAMVNLGVVYNRQGQADEAIRAFKRAVQVRPNLVAAHLNLSVTYFKAGRYEEAITTLGRVAVLEPANVQGQELMALSLIALEKFQEA